VWAVRRLKRYVRDQPVRSLILWALLWQAFAWATMLFGDAPDSSTYTEVLHDLRHLDFRGFDGVRTPGAPAFWLLLGSNRTLIAVGAGALVVGGGLLLRRVVDDATGRWQLGLAAGAAYTAWPYLLDGQRVLLSENTATFLTTATIWLAVLLLARIDDRHRAPGLALLLGLAATWLVLVRPAALASILVLAALLLWRAWRAPGRALAATTVVLALAPIAVGYGGWLVFMKHEVGVYAPTTITGGNVADVACRSISHADVRDHDLQVRLEPVVHRLLRRRFSRIKSCSGASARANYAGLDGYAHPTSAHVSQRLTTMTVRLIRRDPAGYLSAVATQGAVQWLGLGYRPAGAMRPGFRWLAKPFSGLEILSQLALNAAFLAASGWWLLGRWRRRRDPTAVVLALGNAGIVSLAFVWANAIANPFLASWLLARLLVPVIPAQLVVVAVAFEHLWTTRAAARWPVRPDIALIGGP
jgi:hypothetical protein